MEIYGSVREGRPEGPLTGAEERAYALLERLGVPFSCVCHSPAATIADCRAVEDALGVSICKNLFLTTAQKNAFFMLVLPGGKQFKTKDLSAQIGSSRLSFAGPDDMREHLGVEPGSVSVLALENDADGRVRLLVDRDVLAEKYFGCHPCKNTASLKVKTADLMDTVASALGHKAEWVTL